MSRRTGGRRTLTVAAAFLLAAGCASAPQAPDIGPRWKFLEDPSRPYEYFMMMMRADLPDLAQEILSREAKALFPTGTFYFGLENRLAPDATRRAILGFAQHSVKADPGGDTGVARWCNPEFGVSMDVRLVRERIAGKAFWTIDFTREQVERIGPAVVDWFRRQREAADGRVYAYPPDWRYAPVSRTCACAAEPKAAGEP